MDLRTLEYFLAIAREQNISWAAEALHVTQPTLSRQMKDLEEELGKQLFIRGNRKITLTEEGMILRKRAEEILDLVKKTQGVIMLADDISEGNIYIGTGESNSFRYITKIMKSFQKQYPNIRFHIISGDTTDVLEHLDKGLYDFGLIYGHIDTSKYEYIEIPCYDYYGILMRKDSELANKEYITPNDLKGLPLIHNRNLKDGDSITNWMDQSISQLHTVATYNLVFSASQMVAEGMGYALALNDIINITGNTNLSFKPLYPEIKVNLRLIWKKYQIFSKPAEKFITQILELEDISSNK